MQFCYEGEIEVWAAERGLPQSGERPLRTMLYYDGLPVRRRLSYNYEQPHTAAGLAAELVAALGTWDEAMLWVTEWGIWRSSEDWPAYYAARGAQGERRSLDEAPGHLFRPVERDTLTQFLTLVLQNGWDAFVLSATAGALSGVRVRVSHDEWAEIQSDAAVDLRTAAGYT